MYTEVDLVRNWTLSRCLGAAIPDASFQKDAYISASAYLEKSQADIDVFEKLDLLIKDALRKNYQGSVTSQYNVMKCIDLYNDRELENIISNALRAAKPGIQ